VCGRAESRNEPASTLAASVSSPAPVPSSQAPEALLEQAHELAARGAFREAMSRALAALLRFLEVRGTLELHPSRTNGEYLRRLRSNRPLADDVRNVVVAVESVEFGGEKPSRQRSTELLERVSRIVGALFGLLLAAAWSPAAAARPCLLGPPRVARVQRAIRRSATSSPRKTERCGSVFDACARSARTSGESSC